MRLDYIHYFTDNNDFQVVLSAICILDLKYQRSPATLKTPRSCNVPSIQYATIQQINQSDIAVIKSQRRSMYVLTQFHGFQRFTFKNILSADFSF